MKLRSLPTALSIAGTDPTGGAGIGADLKTFTARGVYGQSCITAVIAQNTLGVQHIELVAADLLWKQMESVFTDIYPNAVKIGMLGNTENIEAVVRALTKWQPKNIVLDPVMLSSSGTELLKAQAQQTLCQQLFPLCTLITPNIPEAQALTGQTLRTEQAREDMLAIAHKLAAQTGAAILLKGGHLSQNSDDLLLAEGKEYWFAAPRIDNPNSHGTGCTLSSAIAAELAKGSALPDAVCAAKQYITDTLRWGLKLGHGTGPLCHMPWLPIQERI